MTNTERLQNMTQGDPARLIFSFAIPLMLGNVFQQLYTTVDTVIVGQALGLQALAALGAAEWLNWLVLGMIQGFAQGFSISMAQRFGAGDHRGLNQAIAASAGLAAVISLALLVVSQLAVKPILILMNTPEDILGGALTYLRIMFAGIPVIMAYNVLASILRALGNSKTPLYAMVLASVLNITLDLVFVMVFHWGIAGAVIATVLAQLFAALFCLGAVLRIPLLRVDRADLIPSRAMCRLLLGHGSPVALQNMIIAVGGMVVQAVVNRYGVIFVAGFTATNKLYGLLEIAATSFGYAVTTYVGQNIGAKKYDRVKKGVFAAWLMSSGVILVCSICIFSAAPFLISIFTKDAEVIAIGSGMERIFSACYLVLPVVQILNGALRGAGLSKIPMYFMLGSFVVLRQIYLMIAVPLTNDVNVVMAGWPITWIACAIGMAVYYFKTDWLKKNEV